MPTVSGVKFRCRPTADQIAILNQWIGHQRHIYNAKVMESKYYRTFRKHSLAHTGEPIPSDQQYSRYKDKELTPFLFDVPSQVLRNGAYRYMQGLARYHKGLGGLPSRKLKHGKQTVMLTNELFRFEPVPNKPDANKLIIGTNKFPIGELKFKAHRPYETPSTITISRHNGEWHVSFNFAATPIEGEVETEPLTEKELIDCYSSLSKEDLEGITIGGDRGVIIPLATSDGTAHDFTDREKAVLVAKEQGRVKYQRRMARQDKQAKLLKRENWSKRRIKTNSKIDKTYTRQRNIRHDRAHKISHALVNTEAKVFVFEDLKVKSMTKRAKPKQDENGKYIKNGAAAKSGLNKAILQSMWGNITMFTKYKALALGKLVIKIPAPGTSQECSECGHTHPDNRESQALFACTGCGFTANADFNAARVIKKRGIESLLSGGIVVKQKKTVKFIKTRAGTPEVMRVDMDCSTISGVVAAAANTQEAIVSRLAGLCLPDAGACESRSSHLNCVSS